MSSDKIDLIAIADKWQKLWKEADIYRTVEDPNKKTFFIPAQFPYPSGEGLHAGHTKVYSAADILARKKKMEGYAVLHPMGWDAFGLPAENYAIKNKVHPKMAMDKNISTFKKQLDKFGGSYDWDREISTIDPDYYKWTQWIFLQLYHHYYDEKLDKAMPISFLEEKIKKGEIKVEGNISNFLDEHRLAYVDYKPINRCPKCKTGLANEDLENGRCERCDSEIERKPMRQWVLRITKYAHRLLSGLDTVDWENSMKDMERNWIGRSEGVQFEMRVADTDFHLDIYTTRIDTVFGMSFVAIAPEHPLVDKITTGEYISQVEDYKKKAAAKTDMERGELNKDKTGVFSGAYAVNPFNNKKVPIYVADYVLAEYGTGAVMAVPAHDERDFEFAQKYGLDIIQVITQDVTYIISGKDLGEYDYELGGKLPEEATSEGKLRRSGEFSGLTSEQAKVKMAEWLESKKIGSTKVNYKIQDWVFSRQRYWGEPIPMIHCKNCALKKIDIKTELSFYNTKAYNEIISGEKIIETRALNPEEKDRYFGDIKIGDLIKINNKNTGDFEIIKVKNVYRFDNLKNFYKEEKLVRLCWPNDDTSTYTCFEALYSFTDDYVDRINQNGIIAFEVELQNFSEVVPLDSSELPLKLPEVENYEPTGTEEGPLANISEWINVRCPKCGGMAKRESNTMPQWAGSSWYWIRYMDNHNDKELVSLVREKYRKQVDVYIGGVEHVTRHMIYARFWNMFLYDIGSITHEEPFPKFQYVGLVLGEDGRKMSKRRGNGVNPMSVIDEFGPDTLRVYQMFMGPFDAAVAWNSNSLRGVKKFLDKIGSLSDKFSDSEDKAENISLLHKTIKKVSEDIDNFKFNTAVSSMMIYINALSEQSSINKKNFEKFVMILSPFAPFLAEELWERLGNAFSIFTKASWPMYDEKLIDEATITLPVQFNGKIRGDISIAKDLSQDEIMNIIKSNDRFSRYITGDIKKIIHVPNKIINIIV